MHHSLHIVTLAIALLTGTVRAGGGPPLDYSVILQKLRSSTVNTVDLQYVGRAPITYQAWGVWTIPYSTRQVASVALDIARYPTVFSHVYRCDSITSPRGMVSPLGTWYVEGRAAMARIWAIGNIDSLVWNADSSEVRLLASQNENRELEKQWRTVLPGWFNFRTRGLRLAAIIVPLGTDSCRVGLVAQAWVNKPMPEWLIRLAIQVVFPKLLQDLDAEVRRKFPRAPRRWLWW